MCVDDFKKWFLLIQFDDLKMINTFDFSLSLQTSLIKWKHIIWRKTYYVNFYFVLSWYGIKILSMCVACASFKSYIMPMYKSIPKNIQKVLCKKAWRHDNKLSSCSQQIDYLLCEVKISKLPISKISSTLSL